MSTEQQHHPITRWECLGFLIAMIGVQLSSELYAQWGVYFYSPSDNTGRTIYVAVGLVGIIFTVGRLFDIFTDSLIGVISDRTEQQPGRYRIIPIHGRRRPFIFWGSILMTFTGIAFWFPPVQATSSLNFLYGTVLMSLHWGLYTLAYIPILALSLDFAKDEASRIRLGAWIAMGMILGIVLAALFPGILIDMLDPARQVEGDTVQYSAVGYQRVAILFAIISLLSFQIFLRMVKERPQPPADSGQGKPLQQLTHALRLPKFRLYLLIFFLFYIGILAVQRILPYYAELALEGDEATVTLLGIPFLLSCIVGAALCPVLIKRMALKGLMILGVAAMALGLPILYLVAVLDAPAALKTQLAMALFAFNGFGQGIMYVLITPLIGEIVDEYRAQYGEQKEAVFNALHAMIVKFAQVFGILLATQLMNNFGKSPETPTGVYLVAPIGGIFCIIALVLALRYPGSSKLKSETKEV